MNRRKAYKTYMTSPKWRTKRAQALKYWGNKCQVCGSRFRLAVHHATYVRFGGKEKMTDLRVLCAKHHKDLHYLHRRGGQRQDLMTFTVEYIKKYKRVR